MADASMGHQARLSLAAASTAIGFYTEAYEFVSENLQKKLTRLDTSGIRGSRSHTIERSRDGTYTVGGTINFHATPAMLDLLLPRILGANESIDTFALAEALQEFDVLIDRVAKRFVYGNCKVSRATFRASASGLLELSLDVVGKTETVSATAFPSITAPTDPPYVMQDGAFTLVSSARKVMEFELVIDNQCQQRFTNSQSATDVSAQDRLITCRFRTPYTSDEVDLYTGGLSAAAALSIVFTNGGYSTTFTIPKFYIEDSSPVVGGKGEIVLESFGQCLMSSTTRELVITHDSTA